MYPKKAKERVEISPQSTRLQLDQLELVCQELSEKNELLTGLLFEWGDVALWEKLFQRINENYKEKSDPTIIEYVEEFISLGKFPFALIGLNQLLRNPTSGAPSTSLQVSLTSVLVRIFETELQDLDEIDQRYMSIFIWLQEAADTQYRQFLSEWLQQNQHFLQRRTSDTNSPEVILTHLRALLAYDHYYPLRDYMEYLLVKEWKFMDAKLDEPHFSWYLWLAFYLSMDDVLIETSNESVRFLEHSFSPEIDLYRKYYASKNHQSRSIQALDEMLQLMTGGALFNESEKSKLWEELVKLVQRNHEAAAPNEKSLDYSKAGDVWQIKNKTDHCPHCKQSKLSKKFFVVDGFKKKSDQAQIQKTFELLSCSQCQQVYLYGSMVQQLNRTLAPYHCIVKLDSIDYPADRNKKPIKLPITVKIPPTSKVTLPSGMFSWPSTNAKESSGQSDREGNFREETDLHRLGYRITGLNRPLRWEVLVRKAISDMPLKDIVYTIARNVRLRKSQVGGSTKFNHAITEWEHDLKRLKQEYYKSNFTWPQY